MGIEHEIWTGNFPLGHVVELCFTAVRQVCLEGEVGRFPGNIILRLRGDRDVAEGDVGLNAVADGDEMFFLVMPKERIVFERVCPVPTTILQVSAAMIDKLFFNARSLWKIVLWR